MLTVPDFREKHTVLVFAKEGQRVTFKNDNLVIKDAEGKIVLQLTCYRIFSLWIVGNITLSSGILERSKKYCFSIILFTYGFRPYGAWNSTTEGNFLLRQKQYRYSKIDIPKQIIANKIDNQRLQLKTIRKKSNHCKEAIKKLNEYVVSSAKVDSLDSLLGLEGSASKMYFQTWFADMEWKGRKPRAKRDPTNVLLDIGYTLLFHFVDALLNLYGFDVYQGVYHQNFYQRKSLVCDIVEPFRGIVDRTVRKAHSLKQIHPDDFVEKQGRYLLSYQKSKPYTQWLLRGILDYKEDLFVYVQQYYRCFIRDKSISEYPVFDISNPRKTKE